MPLELIDTGNEAQDFRGYLNRARNDHGRQYCTHLHPFRLGNLKNALTAQIAQHHEFFFSAKFLFAKPGIACD